MAERLKDGTIRLKDGRILYGNSIPMLEQWPELLEILRESPAMAAAREITKTSTEAFLREVRQELDKSADGLRRKESLIRAELDRREEIQAESRFRGPDGRVYHFTLEQGRECANFWLGHPGWPVSIGIAAVLDRREVDRARKMLGIFPKSPAGRWFEACLEVLKVYSKSLKRLGTTSFHMRTNQRGGKGKMRIGKARANYPRAKGT